MELQQRLGGDDHQIPIVVVTALHDDETRRRVLRAGAVAFLSKPFDGEALLDAVKLALGTRSRARSREAGHGV
jgi:FixJ family two-component response regulator